MAGAVFWRYFKVLGEACLFSRGEISSARPREKRGPAFVEVISHFLDSRSRRNERNQNRYLVEPHADRLHQRGPARDLGAHKLVELRGGPIRQRNHRRIDERLSIGSIRHGAMIGFVDLSDDWPWRPRWSKQRHYLLGHQVRHSTFNAVDISGATGM